MCGTCQEILDAASAILNDSTLKIGLVSDSFIDVDNAKLHALKHLAFGNHFFRVSLSVELNDLAILWPRSNYC